MIIPHAHAQRLTDISDEASSEVHKLLILTQKILTEEYKPGGFNIGMNVGRTGGAGIAEHLHYHIVPRWDGDSNFMPILGGTKVVSESLEQTFNRLKPAFQKHAKQLEEQGPDISLDHVGIAVSSHKEAYSFWNVIGWKQDAHPETVADQKVRVAMLPVTNRARVELLEPTDAESPISKFVSKRGPGIHHLCFRVTDIEAQLKKLKDSGIKLINEAPVAGAHGCKVAFIHPSSTGGVLVELSEKANEGQL